MVYLMTFSAFLLAMVFLALGVIISNKRIQGSCGGQQVLGPDGEPLGCGACPNRHKNSTCKNRKA